MPSSDGFEFIPTQVSTEDAPEEEAAKVSSSAGTWARASPLPATPFQLFGRRGGLDSSQDHNAEGVDSMSSWSAIKKILISLFMDVCLLLSSAANLKMAAKISANGLKVALVFSLSLALVVEVVVGLGLMYIMLSLMSKIHHTKLEEIVETLVLVLLFTVMLLVFLLVFVVAASEGFTSESSNQITTNCSTNQSRATSRISDDFPSFEHVTKPSYSLNEINDSDDENVNASSSDDSAMSARKSNSGSSVADSFEVVI